MKRTIQFNENDDIYYCEEDDKQIFEIKKSDLKFDVKKFYMAFYADDKDFKDIHLKNMITDNKKASRVFKCINDLVEEINKKLKDEIK